MTEVELVQALIVWGGMSLMLGTMWVYCAVKDRVEQRIERDKWNRRKKR